MSSAPASGGSELVPLPESAIKTLSPILDAVPTVGEDAWESILSTLMAAESPEDLDRPWRSEGLTDYIGRRIRVIGVRKARSAYESGWGYFLILDIVDPEDGEKKMLTTGSTSVVPQLALAAARGWLPMDFVVRQSDRATENGYYPIHLDVAKGKKS